ncbi:uncharacterized protein V1513DRAFT_447190 [Lipomyces chichibuensis]|uniref:uncharacterized protein n=1 Tax=Lipomyces chichibuensis TaxID=1546026 RepID=UPI0033435B27
MSLSESEWKEFESYEWASDRDFTQGLASVLSSRGSTLSDDEKWMVECKARLFFYSRKVQKNVGYEDYIAWKACHTRSAVSELSSEAGDRVSDANVELQDQEVSERDDSSIPNSSASSSQTPTPSPSPIPSTSTRPPSASSASATGPSDEYENNTAPYPSSFAHIVELITSGKEVPGIKQIPNILLGETASSRPERPQRRKPWAK